MKITMIKTSLTALLAAFLLVPAPQARAADSDGFGQLFEAFFGSESSKNALKVCVVNDNDSHMGIMGFVNSMFCHMEKDMGITGPTTGVTKNFGNTYVRAVVTGSAGGASFSGYDYQAQIWTCAKSNTVTCTQASQFNRAMYIAWSKNASNTINKGTIITDSAAFQGNSGSVLSVTYDVGTGTTPRTVSATYVSGSQKFESKASANGTVLSVAMIQVNGSNGLRFAAAIDTSKNQAGASLNLVATSNSLSGDSITFSGSQCFTRSVSGDDFTYTPASGCTLGSVTMPTDSISTLNGMTATTLATGGFASMSANPSAI